MATSAPPNEEDVRRVVEERLEALASLGGVQETATVEWRNQSISVQVVSMPVELLYYNPDTHRVRAQRSMDPVREQALSDEPYGIAAQTYLHELLTGDPTEPSKRDPAFDLLKEDLRANDQKEPGIITRAGILVNGNTRRAALKELGVTDIRVGVLPPDAGRDDIEAVELSLQLRKDLRRDYSFMNLLLAIDERVAAGHLPRAIQQAFRIQAKTYDRCVWILEFVRDAIQRSQVDGPNGERHSMRLIDFESHQGKLEELYRAYISRRRRSTEEADLLREQRLLALVLDKSKTDLRLIDADFAAKYMKPLLPATPVEPEASFSIPGTKVVVPGGSSALMGVRDLCDRALRARSQSSAASALPPTAVTTANQLLSEINDGLDKALDSAGKQVRVLKKRVAPVDRISDACDDLELAVSAVADARSTGNFVVSDLDDALLTLQSRLEKLAALAVRGSDVEGEGVTWLRNVVALASDGGLGEC